MAKTPDARRRVRTGGPAARGAHRLALQVWAGLLAGSLAVGTGTGWLMHGTGLGVCDALAENAPAAPAAAPATTPAATTQKTGTAAATGRAKPGVPAGRSKSKKGTQAASAQGAGARSAAVKTAAAPQDERVTYHYNTLGRRDPFQPLIGGGFVGMDVGGNAPPDVGGISVVGIVWGSQDKFALVEDPRGNSMVLRQGDKVMNGVVEALKRDALVVRLSIDGQSQSVVIPVSRKGAKHVEH